MKNFFKSLAICALAALTFASCQKENADGNMDDQSSVVSINLTSPLMGTKAFADGKTVDVVHVHVYKVGADNTLTYIAPGTGGTETPSKDVTMRSSGTATYSTRLVTGQKYTFVFWAEKSGNGHYKYNPDTKTIAVKYTNAEGNAAAGNDESRDAFYAKLENVTINGAYSASVALKRPFAQINFGASDYDAAVAAGITVTGASVKLTGIANSINLLDGTVSGRETVTFAEAVLPTAPNATLTAANVDYKYVAMDYVLVGKDAKSLSDVTLTLAATGTQSSTPEYTYTNVPLQGNYRTNIVGNLFTSPADINITVDPAFGNPDENIITGVANLDAANTAFANGATAVTVEEITSSDPDVIVLPATTAKVSLTLPAAPDGKTITIKYPDSASNVPATVNIKAVNAASLTINAPQSHVELNGITVTTLTASTSSTTLVVGADVTVGTLTVKAGSAVIYGTVTNLVKEEGAGKIEWHVSNSSNMTEALNDADTIVLEKDIQPSNFESWFKIQRDVTIDLNSFSLSAYWYPLQITKGNVNIIGSGELIGAFSMLLKGSTDDVADYCVVNLGPDVVLKASSCGIIVNPPASTGYNNYGIVVNSEAKIISDAESSIGITINGSNKQTGVNVPKFNITGGTIKATVGIYAAGYAKWNLKNTNITGKESAIEVRAGEVTIDGGEYKATNTPFSITPEGSGNTINGAALGISQHTTDLPINVVVNSGTFTGEYAVYEEDVQNNTAKDQIKLTIKGGTFNGAIYSQNNQNCLVGGTYDDASVLSYTADGRECLMNTDDTYTIVTAQEAGFYKSDGNYIISSPNGLKVFEKKVNIAKKNFSGKTVLLDADIDLQNQNWTPVGQTGATQFLGTFDGQNHTINNLAVVNNDKGGHCATGLFGWLNSATVKNLKIIAATIAGHHNVGTIAGYLETSGCTIENCHVSNATISCTSANEEANGDKCGGIVGHAGNAGVLVKDCTVTNSSISAGRDAGQVVGAAPVENVVNCSATNVTVTANGTSTGANIREEVIGIVL